MPWTNQQQAEASGVNSKPLKSCCTSQKRRLAIQLTSSSLETTPTRGGKENQLTSSSLETTPTRGNHNRWS